MGLHYPFGYVGYESTCLHTFIELMDNFCTGCHTNKDVNGKCANCPVGKLIFKSKSYLLSAYESDFCDRETEIIRQIKKDIKPITPYPFFNANWLTNEKRAKDKLYKLREHQKDLVFVNKQRTIQFLTKSEEKHRLFHKIVKQVEEEMSKKKKR